MLLCCVVLSIGLGGCKHKDRVVLPAFYHWKTNFAPSKREWAYMQRMRANKMYVRYFDVDWNPVKQRAVPLASLRMKGNFPRNCEIVPTVYITNRTLVHTPDDQVGTLGKRIAQHLLNLTDTLTLHEIQIDCDWTAQSRDRYFLLLDQLGASFDSLNVELSSTIRLHQVKYYEQTGVPPVQRGMLMFYNMSDVRDEETRNSILDLEVAEAYVEYLEAYPLPLDLALPIFSWGVVRRSGKTVHLINNLRAEQLKDTTRFAFLPQSRIEVKKSTYLNGFYLYAEDTIRIEDVSVDRLEDAAKLLAENLKGDSLHISFYHLDTPTIQQYPHETLESVIAHFR
ncbi:MAG: hypothetical protein AAFV07_15500 [Bacteroidota bacterium]